MTDINIILIQLFCSSFLNKISTSNTPRKTNKQHWFTLARNKKMPFFWRFTSLTTQRDEALFFRNSSCCFNVSFTDASWISVICWWICVKQAVTTETMDIFERHPYGGNDNKQRYYYIDTRTTEKKPFSTHHSKQASQTRISITSSGVNWKMVIIAVCIWFRELLSLAHK